MKPKPKKPQTRIHDCTFTGVHYDAKACECIQTIAEGLAANARGLAALANVLNASNVTIDALLKVGLTDTKP